jgi:hypothetical protein
MEPVAHVTSTYSIPPEEGERYYTTTKIND